VVCALISFAGIFSLDLSVREALKARRSARVGRSFFWACAAFSAADAAGAGASLGFCSAAGVSLDCAFASGAAETTSRFVPRRRVGAPIPRRSRCNIDFASATLPRLRSGVGPAAALSLGAGTAVSLDEEASLFRILTASLAAWALSALVMRRFLSPAVRAFSLPDLAAGFLSTSSLPSGRPCLVVLVFGFSRLAFFSRSASIRGVVLAFSCFCPSLSGAAALAMGLVRLSRKSLNS